MVEEPSEPVVQQLPQDKQSLLRHLEKTNPEALALANDWDDVAYSLVKSKAKIEKYVYMQGKIMQHADCIVTGCRRRTRTRSVSV